MKLSHQLLGNSFYRLLNLAVVFAINVLLARLMKADGYGMFSLMLANVTFLNMLTSFGADAAITYQAASGKITTGKIICIVSGLLIVQVVIALIIENGFKVLTGHYWIYQGALWTGVLYLFIISGLEKSTALYNGKHLYIHINKYLFVSNLFILIVLMALFIGYNKAAAVFYLQFYIAVSLLQLLIIIVLFFIATKEKPALSLVTTHELSPFFSYSIIVFITNSIQFLAYRVDYWFMDFYHGKQSLGIYALAVKLSQLFWILPIAFAGIIFPATAKQSETTIQNNLPSLIRLMNLFNIVTAVLACFLMPFVLPFVFGEEYIPAIAAFLILLPGVILFCTATILAAYYAGINKLKVNLLGSVICFLIILVLDIWLIPTKGIRGAAIASSTGYGITGIYYLLRFTGEYKIPVVSLLYPSKEDWVYLKQIKKNLFKQV